MDKQWIKFCTFLSVTSKMEKSGKFGKDFFPEHLEIYYILGRVWCDGIIQCKVGIHITCQ